MWKILWELNDGKLKDILDLFSEGVMVISSLYGEMLATDFYRELFQNNWNSETKFLGLYETINSSSKVILDFNYKWILKSNPVVNFECIDCFELIENKDKFKKLKLYITFIQLKMILKKAKTIELTHHLKRTS